MIVQLVLLFISHNKLMRYESNRVYKTDIETTTCVSTCNLFFARYLFSER